MFETIWFVLWGILWAIYFMLDGFDLGLGSLMPFIARDNTEKRILYNVMGPFWDGNEVWLITAGGVTFAAFPKAYAVMFSTLYAPLLLLLFALILRGVSFEFRGKIDSPSWRRIWDTCLFIGSFLPALLLGVAFANIFKGISFDGNGVYYGSLLSLLNSYGLIGGMLFMMLFLVHGLLWLINKTEESLLRARAERLVKIIWLILAVLTMVFLITSWFSTQLYRNYLHYPVLFLIPLIAIIALLGARFFIAKQAWWKAWFFSALTIAFAALFGIAGLYPNLFPSSMSHVYNLTIWNSSSSPLTLKIMLGVVIVFVPMVIWYQSWAYKTFHGKVTLESMSYTESY